MEWTYYMMAVKPQMADEPFVETAIENLRRQGWIFDRVGPSTARIEIFFKRPVAAGNPLISFMSRGATSFSRLFSFGSRH